MPLDRATLFDSAALNDLSEVSVGYGVGQTGQERALFLTGPGRLTVARWVGPLAETLADPDWLGLGREMEGAFVIAHQGWFGWFGVYPEPSNPRYSPRLHGKMTTNPLAIPLIAKWLGRSLGLCQPGSRKGEAVCCGCLHALDKAKDRQNVVAAPSQMCHRGVQLLLTLSTLTAVPILVGGATAGRSASPCGSSWPLWPDKLREWTRVLSANASVEDPLRYRRDSEQLLAGMWWHWKDDDWIETYLRKEFLHHMRTEGRSLQNACHLAMGRVTPQARQRLRTSPAWRAGVR